MCEKNNLHFALIAHAIFQGVVIVGCVIEMHDNRTFQAKVSTDTISHSDIS
jgi:hypothetical protein